MTLTLYRLLQRILTPWLYLRLRWRARSLPDYGEHIAERFGHYTPAARAPATCIWVHAVSVGEVRAAAPLITSLLIASPATARHLVLTVMTPTGRATALNLFAKELAANQLTLVYAPYDTTRAVTRFLDRFAPALYIVMETEVWPNQLALLHSRGIACVLANARLSAKSHAGYAKRRRLIMPAFAAFTHVLAQSETAAARFRDLGAKDVRVLGNLKFDATPSAETQAQGASWRDACVPARRVLLLAATREGEEVLLLDALKAHPTLPSDVLVVLVPRHPQRFDEVAALIAARGFVATRRSVALPDASTQIWLGDSMGEMAAYIAYADVVLVGGSLGNYGAQTPIEAMAQAKPVLIGPSTYNFAEVSAAGLEAAAIEQHPDASALIRAAFALLDDPVRCQAMGRAGQTLVTASAGATARSSALLEALLARPALSC